MELKLEGGLWPLGRVGERSMAGWVGGPRSGLTDQQTSGGQERGSLEIEQAWPAFMRPVGGGVGRQICVDGSNPHPRRVAPNRFQFKGTKEAIHASPGSEMSGGGVGLGLPFWELCGWGLTTPFHLPPPPPGLAL